MTEILINVKEIRIITNNITARIVYYIDEETDYRWALDEPVIHNRYLLSNGYMDDWLYYHPVLTFASGLMYSKEND